LKIGYGKFYSVVFNSINLKLGEDMGIWYSDSRMDWHEIEDDQVKKNANCVAVICREDKLIEGKEFSILKVKNFGKTFNLCEFEPFYDQPISTGGLMGGALVREDIIATAAHALEMKKIEELRFVFGYKMLNPSRPVKRISNKDIYRGVNIIHKVLNPSDYRADWALVKLDRKVEGQRVAVMSKSDISCDQSVYMIGYPMGLPLKYVHGAKVREIDNAYFDTDLDTYMGNSGSPVFNSDTHEMIGLVVRGNPRDLRWGGKDWISVVYPDPAISSWKPACIKISEFIRFVD
jgi:hypothetical protein